MNPTARKVWIVCGALALLHLTVWAFTGLSLVAPLAREEGFPIPPLVEALRGFLVAVLHVVAIVGAGIALDLGD